MGNDEVGAVARFMIAIGLQRLQEIEAYSISCDTLSDENRRINPHIRLFPYGRTIFVGWFGNRLRSLAIIWKHGKCSEDQSKGSLSFYTSSENKPTKKAFQ